MCMSKRRRNIGVLGNISELLPIPPRSNNHRLPGSEDPSSRKSSSSARFFLRGHGGGPVWARCPPGVGPVSTSRGVQTLFPCFPVYRSFASQVFWIGFVRMVVVSPFVFLFSKTSKRHRNIGVLEHCPSGSTSAARLHGRPGRAGPGRAGPGRPSD